MIKVIFSLLLIFTLPVQQVFASFKDVDETFWGADTIDELVELGIVSGYDDQTFRPNQKVTREQAAIMLSRALKLDGSTGTVQYSDIDKKRTSYKAIVAITNAGIMSGNKGKFEPTKPMTRAQVATVLTKAFELKGNGLSSFKDVAKNHYAYSYIDAVYANDIAYGYDNNTFKPSNPVTRIQFVSFLSRALNNGQNNPNDSETVKLLKEVYANEQQLETYEFEGKMNLGISVPQSAVTTSEDAAILDMLKDINVTISGAYQKDPMRVEANVDVTLKGDMPITLTMPMIMTQDKMWMKLPQIPWMPLPEEMQGKFIEYDFAKMSAMLGQATPAIDMDVQTKLGAEIINIFVGKLGDDFYKELAIETVTMPNGVEADKVIKFELTNETLKPFIDTLVNEIAPQFIKLLENPKYGKALGLKSEDVAMVKMLLKSGIINVDEVASEISKVVDINQFDEHIFIHPSRHIDYDVVTLDLAMTVENESFGLKMLYDIKKSKVNEEIKFPIGTPKNDDIIPFDKLLQMEEMEGLQF